MSLLAQRVELLLGRRAVRANCFARTGDLIDLSCLRDRTDGYRGSMIARDASRHVGSGSALGQQVRGEHRRRARSRPRCAPPGPLPFDRRGRPRRHVHGPRGARRHGIAFCRIDQDTCRIVAVEPRPTDPRLVWLSRASYRANDRPALRNMIRDRASWVAHARTVHDEPTADDDPDAGDPIEVATLREVDAASALGSPLDRQRHGLGPDRRDARPSGHPVPGRRHRPRRGARARSSPAPSRAWTSRPRCVTWSPTTR